MKNIHILPTDKPSRISIRDIDNKLCIHRPEVVYRGINQRGINQNIYITSDEKPKAGEYAIATLNGNSEVVQLNQSTCIYYDSKIVLTTDQDLIKDGVQAIDDEFLEWFVKNPSWDSVEVQDMSMQYHDEGYYEYKIIIPKEEAKQEGYICPHTKLQCDDECCVSASDCHIKTTIGIISEHKQETLEEYDIKDNKIMLLEEDLECVNMYLDDLKLPRTDNKGNEYSIVGRIKRLQEIMYSEEEVEELLNKRSFDLIHKRDTKTANEWFDKYKKK
jgi:hypothetical protein